MKKRTLATIIAGTLILTGCPQKVYAHEYSHVEKDEYGLSVRGILSAGDYDNNKDLNFEILTMNGRLDIQSLCTGSDGNEAVLNTIREIINTQYEGIYTPNKKKREYRMIQIKGEYKTNKGKRVFEIEKGENGGILIIYKDGTLHHLPIV